VHMDLQKEFAADLRRLGGVAHDLRLRLEALPTSKWFGTRRTAA